MDTIELIQPQNDYRIEGDVVWITLTQGQEACVDLTDWPEVMKYRWYAWKIKRYKTYYARAREGGKDGGRHIRMHRLIMGVLDAPPGTLVDHRDRNGLNNRRFNLRCCTTSQNTQNSSLYSTNTSGFAGVWWSKRKHRWMAILSARGAVVFRKQFETKAEAIEARLEAEHKYFGEFAPSLNTVTTRDNDWWIDRLAA